MTKAVQPRRQHTLVRQLELRPSYGTWRINGGKPSLLSCKQLPIVMIWRPSTRLYRPCMDLEKRVPFQFAIPRLLANRQRQDTGTLGWTFPGSTEPAFRLWHLIMDELPQWPTASHLDEVPTPEEVQHAVRCRLVRPQAPMESPLMSSSMEARICYDTCLICSRRYGLKRVCHRTSRTHLSCTCTSVKETELSVTITEAYLCYQSLGKSLHA